VSAELSGSPLRALRESLERNPPTLDEAVSLLDALRRREDVVAVNDFNERVWFGPLIVDGKRLGITDCCFASDPCPRHRAMADAKGSRSRKVVGTSFARQK